MNLERLADRAKAKKKGSLEWDMLARDFLGEGLLAVIVLNALESLKILLTL